MHVDASNIDEFISKMAPELQRANTSSKLSGKKLPPKPPQTPHQLSYPKAEQASILDKSLSVDNHEIKPPPRPTSLPKRPLKPRVGESLPIQSNQTLDQAGGNMNPPIRPATRPVSQVKPVNPEQNTSIEPRIEKPMIIPRKLSKQKVVLHDNLVEDDSSHIYEIIDGVESPMDSQPILPNKPFIPSRTIPLVDRSNATQNYFNENDDSVQNDIPDDSHNHNSSDSPNKPIFKMKPVIPSRTPSINKKTYTPLPNSVDKPILSKRTSSIDTQHSTPLIAESQPLIKPEPTLMKPMVPPKRQVSSMKPQVPFRGIKALYEADVKHDTFPSLVHSCFDSGGSQNMNDTSMSPSISNDDDRMKVPKPSSNKPKLDVVSLSASTSNEKDICLELPKIPPRNETCFSPPPLPPRVDLEKIPPPIPPR